LPLAYNRDLQEDKEPIFDSIDQLLIILPALAGMVSTLAFDRERLERLAPMGFSLATDIADWLVRQRVPFAEAHEIAGECVRRCEAAGLELTELNTDDLAEISPHLTSEVRSVLTVLGSIDSRTGRGGTALVRVREQLDEVRDAMDSVTAWLDGA
jgi:argininosuccinate lyase